MEPGLKLLILYILVIGIVQNVKEHHRNHLFDFDGAKDKKKSQFNPVGLYWEYCGNNLGMDWGETLNPFLFVSEFQHQGLGKRTGIR